LEILTGGNKDVLALDARLEAFGQTLTNFIFVAIDVSSVNVLVADLESMRNSILDLAGSRLPRSQTCTKLSPARQAEKQ
jgi:hypothetical protein